MKMRMDRGVAVLLSSATFWLCACQGELAVVERLDDGSSNLALDEESEGGAPGTSPGGDAEPVAETPVDSDEAATLPCSCASSPSLTALGCEFGGVPLMENDIVQTTVDGSVVAFTACSEDGFFCQVLRWTVSDGLQQLGQGMLLGLNAAGDRLLTSNANLTLHDLEDNRTELALNIPTGHGALSASGDVIVGQEIVDNVAYLVRWTAGEVERIQDMGLGAARVYVNPDATSAIGVSDFRVSDPGFRWTQSDGFSVGLPGVPEGVDIWPQALTPDGSVIAGWALPSGTYFRWSEADGFEVIASTSGRSDAFRSSDGAVVAGSLGGSDDPASSRAFRWDATTGAQVITPGVATQLIDLSDDGSVAVATSVLPDPGEVTYVWDQTNGARTLEELLDARGVDRSGWEFGMARVLSGDGKVLLGLATCGGSPTLYRVEL